MLLMMKIAFMMSSVLGVVKNPRRPHKDFVRVFILIILIRLSETSASGGHVVPRHIAVHRAFVLMRSWLQKCMMRVPRYERVITALMQRGLARLVENGDHLDRVLLEARVICIHHRGLGCREDYLYYRVDLDLPSGQGDQISESRLRINRREYHFGA
jgi:hypothetical protein